MAASLLRLQDMRLQMDDGSNGCIERDEIPKAIRKIGSDAPPKVMDAIIKSLDQNRSEAFNYREIAPLAARAGGAPGTLPHVRHGLSAKDAQRADACVLQRVHTYL